MQRWVAPVLAAVGVGNLLTLVGIGFQASRWVERVELRIQYAERRLDERDEKIDEYEDLVSDLIRFQAVDAMQTKEIERRINEIKQRVDRIEDRG